MTKEERDKDKVKRRKYRHGMYSLLAMRTSRDRPSLETRLGRAFKAAEQEYVRDLGGEESMSRAMRQLINDTTWCDFFVATLDYQIQDRRQFTRDGKPIPIIELRMRIASHRRENYRLLGLERRTKIPSVSDIDWDKEASQNSASESSSGGEAK